ncbi:tandem-95 repeat protein [Chitinimonas arctica]|uniref:Tandem-95 repeat protein n=1 Tax=Chitinimonas arctica TaxID=2594795 RepID=A0A516SK50_9NEIS|nr:Ig-like domain-containing protein [Chitinimonas arctica]QDQ28535.1 tandem-95 repeat protein [Chitinimonas arctica]
MLTRTIRPRLPLLLTALLAPLAALADTPPATQGEGALQLIGETARISVGYARGGHFQGELMGVLHEGSDSAWLGEGWFSQSAGGLQLSYHRSVNDEVRKYFIALDQNQKHDRKLTVGTGLEQADWFGNLYLSHGLSGKRLLEQASISTVTEQAGNVAGRPYLDTVTTTTTTKLFERAYEYGLGLRVGHYFADNGLRITSGFDYEWGRQDARQSSLSVAAEKFFIGTPHSIALQLEHSRKTGAAEIKRNDNRAVLSYRYSFGKPNSQPERLYRMVAETRPVAAPKVIPARTEHKLVKTTASMRSDAFFLLGSTTLTDVARSELDKVAALLKNGGREGNIHIVGHTCDLGSDAVNMKLSIKRAEAVREYLLANGAVPADVVVLEGKGEREPKYPAEAATREKNRRVELEFVSVLEKDEEITVPAQTLLAEEAPLSYRREVVEQEPVWLRLALRTPATHKRTVDVYRSKEETRTESRSRSWTNRAPQAVADSYDVLAGSTTAFAVLGNDVDPDSGDTLKLVSVSAPSQGQVSLDGNRLVYQAPAAFNGEVAFSYTVEDSHGATATGNVTVRIGAGQSGPNRAPQAGNDNATTGRNQPVDIAVLANDSDADGDALTLTVATPAHGSAQVQGNQVRYTPATDFVGEDSFSYTVSDGRGGQTSATVRVLVLSSANAAPMARDDSYSVSGVFPRFIAVMENDSDPDGDTTDIVSLTQPVGGSGTVSISGKNIYFVPAHTFLQDTFTYTISDGKGGLSTATVTLIDP